MNEILDVEFPESYDKYDYTVTVELNVQCENAQEAKDYVNRMMEEVLFDKTLAHQQERIIIDGESLGKFVGYDIDDNVEKGWGFGLGLCDDDEICDEDEE